jgi:hypothetical protein
MLENLPGKHSPQNWEVIDAVQSINQSINQLHVFLARGEPKKGSHSQTTFGGS